MSWSLVLTSFYFTIVFVLTIRIISKKRDSSVSMAWVMVILFLPYIGGGLYLLFGEVHMSRRRRKAHRYWAELLSQKMISVAENHSHAYDSLQGTTLGMSRLLYNLKNSPPLSGNQLELYDDSIEVLQRFIDELDKAKTYCHLLFYIYEPGGKVDEVTEAMIRAVKRGVKVRLLVDNMGSSSFVGSQDIERLKAAGVDVQVALKVGIVRMWFQRIDVRNHRKIFVRDGQIGFTGSQNIADPRSFKQGSDVGQWVDAMVEVQGSAVEALNLVFLSDWCIESHESMEKVLENEKSSPPVGDAITQLVPSGPSFEQSSIHDILITAIYGAREEIVITTPYFVPTPAMEVALKTAALSGVKVTIVVPAKNDHLIVKLASRGSFAGLLKAGVVLKSYQGGLLHSKTFTIDGEISMIGSVNMDMRSFYINFEVSLFCYDKNFGNKLRLLQASYFPDSENLLVSQFPDTRASRLLDGVIRIFSPLL